MNRQVEAGHDVLDVLPVAAGATPIRPGGSEFALRITEHVDESVRDADLAAKLLLQLLDSRLCDPRPDAQDV